MTPRQDRPARCARGDLGRLVPADQVRARGVQRADDRVGAAPRSPRSCCLIALRGAARGALRRHARATGLGAACSAPSSVAAPFLLITFGEHEVPSGLTAVLISPAALFVALFAPFIDPSERIDRRQARRPVRRPGGRRARGRRRVDQHARPVPRRDGDGRRGAFYALGGFVVKSRYGRLTSMQTSFVSLSVASLMTLPLAIATAPVRGARPRRHRRRWSRSASSEPLWRS